MSADEPCDAYVGTCDGGECDEFTVAVVLTDDGWLSLCRLHASIAVAPPLLDYDLAHDIAQQEIEKYIEIAFKTVMCGLPDTPEETAREMRWLHLAEPNLPASAIVDRLRKAGAS